jgi:glutamate-1-semialdehyde 2,1-aminomutase
VNAVIGRRAVMEHAQDTFISSTFWTERIGSAAALAALAAMRDEDAPARIDALGATVTERWCQIAAEAGVSIAVSGLPALASITFPSPDHLAYKTLITQEMLKRGYLATTSFYASIAHDPATVDAYLGELARVFQLIRACEDGTPVSTLLEGPVCQAGFSRLA